MNIEHQTEKKGGIFFAKEGDVVIGEMTYIWGDERMIIDHTFVLGNHRGKGVAEQLVKSAVDYARENGFKIVPVCPYVVSEFKRHLDYADVS